MSMAAVDAPEFTTREVLALTGITYRRLDYWTRLGVLDRAGPLGLRARPGSGTGRVWRAEHVQALRVCARLADCFTDDNEPSPAPGVPTPVLAHAVEALRRYRWPTSGYLLACGDGGEWAPDVPALTTLLDAGQPWLVLTLTTADRP